MSLCRSAIGEVKGAPMVLPQVSQPGSERLLDGLLVADFSRVLAGISVFDVLAGSAPGWPCRASAPGSSAAAPTAPIHKRQDPRTPVLLRIAEEEGLRGPHLRLFEAVGRVAPQALGRALPLNGAGVCGAALADLGLPLELLRGVALLARTAGLLGQLAEELRQPVAQAIYLDVDRNAVYVAPEDGASSGS